MTTRIFHYDDTFKKKFVDTVKKLLTTSPNCDDFHFGFEISELENSQLLTESNQNEYKLESNDFVINEDCTLDFYYDYSDEDCDFTIAQADIPQLLNELDKAELYNNCEYFYSERYIVRVSTDTYLSAQKHLDLMFAHSKVAGKGIEIFVYNEPSFHFVYKLDEPEHYPHEDCFIIIKGENLNLDFCRMLTKSFIFETNATTSVALAISPVLTSFYDGAVTPDFKGLQFRDLIICEHTEKVIEIYNKAISCEDNEIAILYFTKAIEFVSETVIRAKVTEEGRKALLSNRAMTPDANFIKELQQMFKANSYQKDSESLKLTIQTCGYFKDIENTIPEQIKKLVQKELQKDEKSALGILADSVTATRNSIAHAKANYRASGKEIPEEQFSELSETLRVLSQHCIRWYASQNDSSRVV
jgi:hypothetical protein